MATAAEIRQLLSATSLPTDLVDKLVADAPTVWLVGEQSAVLAGDLALCHPELGDGEVRAVLRSTDRSSRWRLTVLAHDRPRLMADTAGTLASEGLSVQSVSATGWPAFGTAMHSMVVAVPRRRRWQREDWDTLGRRLKEVLTGDQPATVAFTPRPPVAVTVNPDFTGQCLVQVDAPDRTGLLWAITSWFAANDVNVEAANTLSRGARARGTFLVTGDVDSAALLGALSGTGANGGPARTRPLRMRIPGRS
ncbi:MAG: Alpha/beta hydrolase fold [Acidimicrobiales bacterium]|jgi:UTP:GlnB (protein PII) uridylyltransferase|nr:Alpha/beta hydrolase fold [Acidimicrobiales bacterium]